MQNRKLLRFTNKKRKKHLKDFYVLYPHMRVNGFLDPSFIEIRIQVINKID